MKTIKQVSIIPKYVDTIPDDLSANTLYISEKYNCAIHLCLCGCGIKCVTPLNHGDGFFKDKGWTLIKEKDDKISLTPSIGNWSWESTYHAHYIITKNVANFV